MFESDEKLLLCRNTLWVQLDKKSLAKEAKRAGYESQYSMSAIR